MNSSPAATSSNLLRALLPARPACFYGRATAKRPLRRRLNISACCMARLRRAKPFGERFAFPIKREATVLLSSYSVRIKDLFEVHVGLGKSEAALLTASGSKHLVPGLPFESSDSANFGARHGPRHILAFALSVPTPGSVGRSYPQHFLVFWCRGSGYLLINEPGLSGRLRDLLITSKYSGVWVVGNGMRSSTPSSKGVFLGMADARGDVGIHLALRPGRFDLALLGAKRQMIIADETERDC